MEDDPWGDPADRRVPYIPQPDIDEDVDEQASISDYNLLIAPFSGSFFDTVAPDEKSDSDYTPRLRKGATRRNSATSSDDTNDSKDEDDHEGDEGDETAKARKTALKVATMIKAQDRKERNEKLKNDQKRARKDHRIAQGKLDRERQEIDMLKTAHQALMNGINAEDPYKSSRYAIEQTPSTFTDADPSFDLYPHQKSHIGQIDHAMNFSLNKPNSILLASGMSLGKTNIIIGNMDLNRRRPGGAMQILVLPLGLVDQWKDDLDEKLSPKMTYIVYHGNVGLSAAEMQKYDIVITTYDMVKGDFARMLKAEAAMAKSQSRGAGHLPMDPIRSNYPLFVVPWTHEFADEVGCITNKKSLISQAMNAIPCDRRCGATGTPIPNDYHNIQSLLIWLKFEPWNDKALFAKYFMRKSPGRTKAVMLSGARNALLAVTLRANMIRLDHSDEFNGLPVLPTFPKEKRIRFSVRLTDPSEIAVQFRVKRQWDAMYREEQLAKEAAEDPSDPPDPKVSSDDLLPVLGQTRRGLAHPALADDKYVAKASMTKKQKEKQALREEDAPDIMQLLQEALGASQDVQIEDIRLTKSQVVASLRADTKHDWQSARMVVFIRDIKKRLKRSKGKVLVFDESQMVLEVVSNALHANWINHLFIHGSISQADRLAYRDTFKDPESTPRVLLMTSKCGGTGLNGLTVANKCYFITRMLSPAERAQCKARIVRNGNDFNCEVIDFFTNDSIERRTDIITDEKDGKAVRMLDPNKVSAKKRDELCTWDTFERFQKKITFLAVGKKKIAARRGSERASADGNESVSDIPYFSDTTEDDETNPDEERRDAYYGSEDGTSETTYSDAPRSDAPSSDARSSDSDGESPESDTIDDVKEETDLGSHSNPRFSGDGRGTRFTGDPRYRRLRPEDDNEETVYDGDYERGIPRKGNAVPRKGKAVPRKGNAVPRNLQRHPRSYRRRTDLDDRSEDDGPPSAPPTFHRHQHSQYSSDHDRLHWARSQLQIGRHPQIQQPHLNTQYQMGMYQETQQPRTSTNVAGWDGQYHGQSQMTQDPQASYGNTSFRPQAPYPGFPYSPSPNSVTGDGQSTSMRPVYHVPDNAADTGASWIQRPIDQSGDTPAQYGSSTLGYQPTGDPGTIHYNTPFALGNGSFSYNQNPNNHVSPQYTNMAEFGVPTNNTSSSFGFNQMGNNYTYRPNPDVLDPNFDGFTDPRVGPYGNNQTSNNHHNHSNPNANNAGGSRERDSEPDL